VEESLNYNLNYKIEFGSEKNLTPHDVSSKYSPLALAYIGDSIFDLYIKSHFVLEANMQSEKYHRTVSKIVSANAQEKFIDSYFDNLTEEEQAVYRRARNSSPHTKAKNASLETYLKATGFEAVLGFLYLSEQNERLAEIITAALNILY
jgi:ribonuclease-3 family protein